MLDSLIGTTSCIPLTLISVMNAELLPEVLLELLDEPPDPLPEMPDPLPELAEDPLDAAPLAEPLPETESPTAPNTDATVPENGAYSLVSYTVC
jgi:hypothetical protein